MTVLPLFLSPESWWESLVYSWGIKRRVVRRILQYVGCSLVVYWFRQLSCLASSISTFYSTYFTSTQNLPLFLSNLMIFLPWYMNWVALIIAYSTLPPCSFKSEVLYCDILPTNWSIKRTPSAHFLSSTAYLHVYILLPCTDMGALNLWSCTATVRTSNYQMVEPGKLQRTNAAWAKESSAKPALGLLLYSAY